MHPSRRRQSPTRKRTRWLSTRTMTSAASFSPALESRLSLNHSRNSREFAWLLQNIKPPVTRVAFDPAVEEADAPPRWSVGIPELLNDYLVIDYSPWNYPVYVLSQGEGFASIAGEVGEAGNGEGMHAVALFTDQQLAREYLLGAGETGSILALHDLQETRDFLTAIASGANSIAVNPIAEDGKRTAKHCFSIKTVLDKYLVRQK